MFVFVCFFGSNGGIGCSFSCVVYVVVDGLCLVVIFRREMGGGDVDLSGVGFGDDEIIWLEVGGEVGLELVLFYFVICWER